LARDLGVAVNTVKAWISVLEATYQVVVLRTWFVNVGKRLVKMPKIYFADTGTLCYLTGLKEPDHAAAGPLGQDALRVNCGKWLSCGYQKQKGSLFRVTPYQVTTCYNCGAEGGI
jgi:hypothetical protein